MRRDHHLAQLGDEVRAVVTAVCGQVQAPRRTGRVAVKHVDGSTPLGVAVRPRQVGLHDHPGAVFHQAMPHEAQHSAGAGGLLEQPCLRIGHRSMGRVRASFATEVDFGVAVAACGAGHWIGLGGGLVRGGRGRHNGIWRIAGTLVPVGRSPFLRLETLHRRPGLHQGAVDREMIIRQQRCHLAMRQDGGHDLARYVRGQQPVAVLREHGRDPDGIVNPEAHEPAEQQVIIHLLHELPLGADRVEDLQQAGPDQTFRRDGGAALTRVEPVELGIQRAQRIVDDGPDLAQRVSRRNALLEIDVAEQRARHLI